MKSFKIIGLLAMMLFAWACTEDNNAEYNKGDQPLEISASNEKVELDALNPDAEAVKFTWTSGTNYGTGLAIDYTFQLDKEGGNFENGISLNTNRGTWNKAYKNEELNDSLIGHFGMLPDTEAAFQYRVIAKVAAGDIEPQVSPIQTISIKTHKPITKTLYIIGGATPGGWNENEATEMKPITNTSKGFTWTGNLIAGDFKFITTLGSFLPSYNKGVDSTKLVLRETDAQPDDKFVVTEGGTYTINVNLISMSVDIRRGKGPEFTELWFVGNPNGWAFSPMTVDPADPFVFHYNDDLSAGGEFKIGTVKDSWDAVFLRPATNLQSEGAGLDVAKWAGDPDTKWNITGRVYKITLDTRDMKIDILPFSPYPVIYLVGDAPSAWGGAPNGIPMTATANPNILTWTGQLKAGELKFSCDNKSDWNGDWFIAPEATKAPTGEVEPMLFRAKGSGEDHKWKIPEAGTYTIELNQLKETVIIKKQ